MIAVRFRRNRGIVCVVAAVLSLQLFSPMVKAEGNAVLLNDLVDQAKVTADAWQNDIEADPPSVFPPADAFAKTSISTDSGIAAGDIRRFCSSLNVNYAHHEGAPTIEDGVATTSLIIPFTQAVELEQLKMVFSVAPRRYYFNLYTSMDGEEWTFAELNGGAVSIHLTEAYNERGEVVDITEKYVGCYASDPGEQGEYDKVSTLTLKTPVAAKYLKITLYGNDGASGENKVKNQWVSFNNLQLFGSEKAETTEKPTEPSAKINGNTSPKEDDGSSWVIWAVVAAVVVVVAGAVTAVVLVKKRKK